MLKIKIFYILILFNISTNLFAENQMVIIGGGGEPKSLPTTIFDRALKNFAEKTDVMLDWKRDVLFNGGHVETEKIVRENLYQERPKSFLSNEFYALIDNYKKMITSGQIRSGEKILVVINTHGSERTSLEKTHVIATTTTTVTNLNNFSEGTVSLDYLDGLAKLAKEKNVKLGIVDLSCHSGATMPLANENTCVIAATGPANYGYQGPKTFIEEFISSIRPGKSLEEVFLEARGSSTDLAFPMISSPVGRKIQNEIYALVHEYLDYFDEKGDKITRKMKDDCTLFSYCKEEQKFNELLKLIKSMSPVLKADMNRGIEQSYIVLLNSLKDYYQYQQSIRKSMLDKGFERLSEKYKICANIKNSKEKNCTTYDIETLARMDFASAFKTFEKDLAKAKDPKEINMALSYIEILKRAEAKAKEIFASNPEVAKIDEFFKSLPEKEKNSKDLATKVSESLRSVYLDQYKNLSNEFNEKNPCANFVL